MAPHVALAHPKAPGSPVHVPPPKPEQFALAKPGHRRRQVENPVRSAKWMVFGYGAQQRFDLLHFEESNVRGLLDLRSVHSPTRVLLAPTAALTKLEDLVEQGEGVARQLR